MSGKSFNRARRTGKSSNSLAVVTDELIQEVAIAIGPGVQGPAGTNGHSAYEIAVIEGFVGTQQEWLASLVGDDGDTAFEIAVDTSFALPKP